MGEIRKLETKLEELNARREAIVQARTKAERELRSGKMAIDDLNECLPVKAARQLLGDPDSAERADEVLGSLDIYEEAESFYELAREGLNTLELEIIEKSRKIQEKIARLQGRNKPETVSTCCQ